MPNLTNLQNVKQWSNIQTAGDDSLLSRLIASCSTIILSYLQRPNLFKTNAVTKVAGNGKNWMMLPYWPVVSIASVLIDAVSVPAASSPDAAGWALSPWDGFSPGVPQKLTLNGYDFNNCSNFSGPPYATEPFNDGFTRSASPFTGQQNVEIDYVTGYMVQNEPWTIPAAPWQVTAGQPYGTWGQDDGVTFATGGAALTKVASSPATGQYSVTGVGIYSFAAADAGRSVLINYSYIPQDIEQACIELVGERYSYRGRIGQRSHSLGGQTTASYNTDALTKPIMLMLQPYRRMFVQ